MNIMTMARLLHILEQLRKHEHWTRAHLDAFQATALRDLREYTYAHSPFYQRFHAGLTDRPLQELPVLTKATMMEHFDDLVTDPAIHLDLVREHMTRAVAGNLFLDRYWLNATSGSSGQPGLFLFNRDEWLTIVASFARAHEWAGARINLTHRMKMATVASVSPWHMSAQVAATVKSWWMPTLRIAASEPLTAIVAKLNDWQPELLVAYASMARILADEQLAGRLHIAPQLIFASSEVLTDETRRRIETAWGRSPFNEYAATETGGVAAECQVGRRLHLFEDLLIVEVVDETNRPVPPGVYGDKVLVTTLFSRTQPLIRYELSDSVKLAEEECLCGRPFAVLESIQGRAEDTLNFPGITGGTVAVHPSVFHHILDAAPVSGWQVVQETDAGVTVLLSGVQEGLADETIIDRLGHALAGQGARVPYIQAQRVKAIGKTTAGKASHIKAQRQLPGAIQTHHLHDSCTPGGRG